jgi:hypothetical protein
MTSLIQHIKDKDAKAIIDYCHLLSQEQRYELIDYLKKPEREQELFSEQAPRPDAPNREAYYTNYSKVRTCYFFAFVACTRSYADGKRTEMKDAWVIHPLKRLLFDPGDAPLIELFVSHPPDYLDKIVREVVKGKFDIIDFNLLWQCYEHGWVQFDEAYFTRSFFTIRMFNRDTRSDAELLLNNKRIFEEVFLFFYRNEIAILDISKWQAREGFVCKKAYEYWTEVIVLLQEKGVVFERSIVTRLLESLLNNWKKGHLDWHVRLLDLFQPTNEELVQDQSLLFSLFGTNNPSLINYAVLCVKKICSLSDFDGRAFIETFALCFSNEKCTKAILSGLSIAETVLAQGGYRDIEFADQYAVLFMHTDGNIQQKVASLLQRFTDAERVNEVTKPYVSYLKQAIKTQLSFAAEKRLEPERVITVYERSYKELLPPATWDELLFQIGQCLRTKSATDIDLFLEGVNRLQGKVPADLQKQLKPYTKPLFSRPWDSDVMAYFTFFLEGWLTDNTSIVIEKEKRSAIPFLKNKCNWLLKKLSEHNALPFLSTPTHSPFFIHPTELIKRVLMYEKQGAEVFYEDLIVACNRVLLNHCDEETRQLAIQLQGKYAKVLCYYVGVSDHVEITADQLAIWSQVTRIKRPQSTFREFEKTEVRDYPGVVYPFRLDFKIEAETNPHITWYKLLLDGNWNRTWYDEYHLGPEYKADDFDHLFYNISALKKAARVDVPYQLSLNPGYVDGQLARYVPRLSTGNEVPQQEDCLYPMQFLVDNKIELHHSGWLYVAACLIFEKKVPRDLAGEYIQQTLLEQDKELDILAVMIGRLIASKYAPVNRLLEFYDRPVSECKVHLFQLQVLEKCIERFDVIHLPTNSKKIVEYYHEWVQRLGLNETDEIQSKIKSMKMK